MAGPCSRESKVTGTMVTKLVTHGDPELSCLLTDVSRNWSIDTAACNLRMVFLD